MVEAQSCVATLVQRLSQIIVHFVIKKHQIWYIGYIGHTFNFKNGYHQNFDGCGTETIDHTNYRQAIQMRLAF